jgi:hypothetical protein
VEVIEQQEAGLRMADLSMLLPENLGSKDIGHEKHTKTPEGAVAGGITGAVIGGAFGWLTASGTIMPPIVGEETSAVAILAGMGALGALGAIIAALLGARSPEYEAKRYEGGMRSGGVLLSVHLAHSCEETAPQHGGPRHSFDLRI